MNRTKILIITITVFWLVMTGWLLRREFFVSTVPTAPPKSIFEEPAESWLGVYLPGDVRAGFIHHRIIPMHEGGRTVAKIDITASLEIQLLNFPTKLLVRGSADVVENEGLESFELVLRSREHDTAIEGKVSEGSLLANIKTGGESYPLTFPVGEGFMLSDGLGLNDYLLPDLEVGKEVVVDAFDPLTLSNGKTRVKCTGEEDVAYDGALIPCKVITATTNNLSTRAWIGPNGEVFRAETPFGFSVRKITQQEALLTKAPETSGPGAELIDIMAIRPTGQNPQRGVTQMTFRISGVQSGNPPPTDDTQTSQDDVTYTVGTPRAPETQASGAIPEQLKEFLEGDSFVQVEHPAIQDLAARIVGDAVGPWQRAQLIYEWVYMNIEKIPVASIPSALDVLEQRTGDCNEHTILYTALARATRIPTRIAIGVVWSDELQGFYYHAWPEVYCGERWYWIDPTLGQPLADATHIKLLTGNIAAWTQLIPYIGQLEIEILQTRYNDENMPE